MEENVPWHRLRAPPIDVPAHVLHASDCLHDLRPEDHIEIQWRKSKELPYGVSSNHPSIHAFIAFGLFSKASAYKNYLIIVPTSSSTEQIHVSYANVFSVIKDGEGNHSY